MPKAYVKVHGGGKVIAISDEEIIGKSIEDKKREIIFNVSEDFYKGELVEIKDLTNFLREGENVNIIGNNSVDFAIENNFIKRENIILIGETKHAQIYKI